MTELRNTHRIKGNTCRNAVHILAYYIEFSIYYTVNVVLQSFYVNESKNDICQMARL